MGTFGIAAVPFDGLEGDDEKECYEFQHLAPVFEDEENVSLADILCLRDSCLTEQEVWAVCVECVRSLDYITQSPLFHTLCITPDTLAFNAHGNVCFIEQLSDDPEGSFIPPEFDKTGNTLEGHIYSLGSTLSAALDYIIEPELEAVLGAEIKKMLEQMQEEKPEDRPHPQDILRGAEPILPSTSSTSVCRKLSAIGRRVLSIESVATVQDGWDASYQKLMEFQSSGLTFPEEKSSRRTMVRNQSADLREEEGHHSQHWGSARDTPTWAHDVGRYHGGVAFPTEEETFQATSDCRSQNSSPVRMRNQEKRLGRARGALNRSCSVPDSNNPPAFFPSSHGDISMLVTDLSDIGDEESGPLVWDERPFGGESKKVAHSSPEWCTDSHTAQSLDIINDIIVSLSSETFSMAEKAEKETFNGNNPLANVEEMSKNSLFFSNNHMTKSMLCLNEESQDEWISLRELLSWSNRPLTVNELWALCYTCLSTLQTYIDFPGQSHPPRTSITLDPYAYLCLDSVYVGGEGEMLFLRPKSTGACDVVYLAPEFQEHGIVTEKACVYGVAAILWATAKFGLSPNQKLAMPRKLRRLLLDMAKRTAIERPSIVMAKKSCRDYLSRQGTNPETVWSQLICRIHKTHAETRPAMTVEATDAARTPTPTESSVKTGFVPLASEAALTPVAGPVPHSYPVAMAPQLPEAFTSSATHFTPIILAQAEGKKHEEPDPPDGGSEWTSSATSGWCKDQGVEDAERPTPGAEEQQTETELECSGVNGSKTERDVAVCDSTSTSSSGQSLVNSPPPLSTQISYHKTNSQCVPACPSLSFDSPNGVCNNFLLRQDPQTGLLTLLPVQITAPQLITAPQPITSHDLRRPLTTGPMEEQITGSSSGNTTECLSAPKSDATFIHQNGLSEKMPHSYPEVQTSDPAVETKMAPEPSMPTQTPSSLDQKRPSLQQIVSLIREEFAFDGYLENGDADLAMGEYILSLRGLQFETFCRAVTEKFCDLYWDGDFLGVLHCLANHGSSSDEPPPSKTRERAVTSRWRAGRGEEREGVESGCELDHNANVHHTQAASSEKPVSLETRLTVTPLDHRERNATAEHEKTEEALEEALEHSRPWNSPEHGRAKDSSKHRVADGGVFQHGPTQVSPDLTGRESSPKATYHWVGTRITSSEGHQQYDSTEKSAVSCMVGRGMESNVCPLGGVDESLCESEALWLTGGWEESRDSQLHRDHSYDMDDADSLTSQGPLSSSLGPQGPSPSFGWPLAFYGEDCFSSEVVEYAGKLGSHSEMPSLEEKTQELHQQLVIETRNLKKTRNFYHKLLHQERKNKGSEAKVMLSKLQVQHDELKSKVEFLITVMMYLQALSVDQWGLDPALLSSLAVTGAAALDLRPCSESTELNMLCAHHRGKGCCPLVAGTPQGLMSYLYARNAHLEGYIQQFLYTYRYFCTPEQLLQFLMEKFASAKRGGHGSSPDSIKVMRRTLDLLEGWISDCRSVDFASKSSLPQTLDRFLTSEVAPEDSRGESILNILQRTPRMKRGRGVRSLCDSPINYQEDYDIQSLHSPCRKSSLDDCSKKSFQWRISRVVEPQVPQLKEKNFSMAAALPRPCYSSLLHQLSSGSPRGEERLPFSQTEHSAQHAAQQLTLLQQEIFQGCHPVHFLNSRAQGVREKTVSVTKCVSSDFTPVEGTSLFVSGEQEQSRPLIQLLKYAESVANWVSAEIVICDSVKAQTALLAKFLSMAKYCYETRNFATAMQILTGLENVIVRQLPAWKQLSAKVCEVLEELRAVQVFLKSDSLCLMEGERTRGRPTLPAAHILALHVQQQEIGAFTLTSGAYKWPKLRNIARVVSQVHACQESVYSYTSDVELQSYMRARISRLGTCDVPLLAADNDANFHQLPGDRHNRRIQDTLRRVKATFQ